MELFLLGTVFLVSIIKSTALAAFLSITFVA
jgi:hypothetical protein